MIPYGRQSINKNDIDAVINVLKSDFLTQGPKGPEFEKKTCEYVNAKYAIAVNSATSALHIAYLALDLQPGDELWTTSTTFVATANCAIYCGAKVDFVDISLKTGLMDTEDLERKLKDAKLKDRLPKIVVPVHLCGTSCDMKRIKELSEEYNFKIVEDASHAIGGSYKGNYIGSCAYSDVCVFSFHPVKIITTGEGGIAVTNHGVLAEKMQMLRSHGITKEPELFYAAEYGEWHYEQQDIGFNYRMTDIQSALGISQLDNLRGFVKRRNFILSMYKDQFENHSQVTMLDIPDDCISAGHLAVILVQDESNITHRNLFSNLRAKGIGVQLHYMPVHLQPYYKNKGFKENYLKNSELYAQKALSLPIYPSIEDEDIRYVSNTLLTTLAKKS